MSFRICPTPGCRVSADHYHHDGHAYAVRHETDASLRSRIAALEEERDAWKKANEELHDAIRAVKDDYANEGAGRFEREKRVVELKQEVDHFRCRLSEETKRSRLYLKALEEIEAIKKRENRYDCGQVHFHEVISEVASIARRALAPQDEKP